MKGKGENMVKLNNVKKNYKDFQLDCSMEIKKGQITGLVGRNGAGKSTTFKAMMGLIKPDEGSIEIFGKSPDMLSVSDKQKIGVVMSDSGFRNAHTINDLVPALKGFYSDFSGSDFKDKMQFYRENYPEVTIERGNIDEVMINLAKA